MRRRCCAATGANAIIAMIAETARGTNVNLFRRYELMRRWREVEQLAFDKFISPDELHMNDWSYACVARALGTAIADAATRPTHAGAAGPAAELGTPRRQPLSFSSAITRVNSST